MRILALLLLALVLALVLGCDGEAPSSVPDAGPATCVPATGELDLLLVVDTSGDSEGFQTLMRAQLETFLQAVQTGDVDLDGASDMSPPSSIRVGAISADMGGIDAIANCEGTGDGGRLLVEGLTRYVGCEAAYEPFQTLMPGDTAADVTEVAMAVGCVVFHDSGCGAEQPLESLRSALLVNEGFFRGDATLAVVVVTKEDDCSFADPLLFSPDGPYPDETFELRCTQHDAAMHPAERYLDALSAQYDPQSVVLGILAGVPPHLEASSASELLDEPSLHSTPDPMGPSGLRSPCGTGGIGAAFPPERLIEVGAGLESRGGTVVLGSVCHESEGYRQTVLRFAEAILRATSRTCPHP
jgi:hypothetical protein